MDKKPVQSLGNEELKHARHENQRLRAEVERIRRERDDAETRFAASQTRIAELEHQIRKHALKITDLEAEGRTLREVLVELKLSVGPRPPVAPLQPNLLSSGIEISDDEGVGPHEPLEKPKLRASGSSEPATLISHKTIRMYQTPQRESQVMDYVSVPHSTSRPRLPPTEKLQRNFVTTSSSMGPSSPGRFKRVRSVSPSIEGNASYTLVNHGNSTRVSPQHSNMGLDGTSTLGPADPSVKPHVKRLKKSEDEDETSLQDVADIYLSNIPSLEIVPPPPDSVYLRRDFLAKVFGGSSQTLVATFNVLNPERRAVFPQSTLNPFLPRSPGAPGLIFASRFEITVDHDPPWALFCKKPSGEAEWRYMGDYRSRRCGTLTAEQFGRQSLRVQQAWGQLIHKTKSKNKEVQKYVAIRARTAFRKAGIDFADDESLVDEEMKKIRKNKGKTLPVTPQDIVDASVEGTRRSISSGWSLLHTT
ncbi:hypothetical protein B0H19DRAFT_545619 [Mycena capillaripes]|nr:hypothetical protein B0H19DRAFT_545619 [Mycena capillaripes]